MPYSVSLENFTPPRRFTADAWVAAAIEEALSTQAVPVEIEAYNLAAGPGVEPIGIDPDPSSPQARSFTTDAATLAQGWYRVRWETVGGATAYSGWVHSTGAQGYPSAADLVADSENEALLAMSATEQEAAYLSAKAAIEDYCGQTFDFEPGVTRQVDGRGGRQLYLPRRLEAVTALTATGTALTLSDITLAEEGDELVVKETAGWGYYAKTITEGEGPLRWPSGRRVVSITGDWGYSVFPEAVRQALRVDMEDQADADESQIAPQVRAFRTLGVAEMSQAGMRLKLGAQTTLSLRAQRLLDGYIWTNPVGELV